MASADRTFSTAQVARATGATYRQVDYWLRRGYVGGRSTPGIGRPRRLTMDQAVRIAMLAEIGAMGIRPVRLRPHDIDRLMAGQQVRLGTMTLTPDPAALVRKVTRELNRQERPDAR